MPPLVNVRMENWIINRWIRSARFASWEHLLYFSREYRRSTVDVRETNLSQAKRRSASSMALPSPATWRVVRCLPFDAPRVCEDCIWAVHAPGKRGTCVTHAPEARRTSSERDRRRGNGGDSRTGRSGLH